jgi:hypothetical protein
VAQCADEPHAHHQRAFRFILLNLAERGDVAGTSLDETWSLTKFVTALFQPTPHEEFIMAHHALASQESYNPNHLLDILLGKMQLKNDAALSRMLEVAPPVISKIRHHRLPVGASLLIRMHEVTGMSIRDLRDLMGDRRTKYRLSDAQGRPKPSEEKAAAPDAGATGNYAH